MRVMITGGSGTLGRRLLVCPELALATVQAPTRGELDVTDERAVQAWTRDARPELVVHCAAVIRSRGGNDPARWAETSRVNVHGTAVVARAAHAVAARLLYVSTDFVFDGSKPGGMYTEDDAPCPLGYYPLSKYAGEALALRHPDAVVVRTSFNDDTGWPYPKAFVDRWTSKLPASEVASLLVQVAQSSVTGVLHVAGPRRSYFEFARTLTSGVEPMQLSNATDSSLMPIDTSLDSSRWSSQRSRR